jgi:hypothetical protein
MVKPPPTLADIIVTWIKKELPKAQYEETKPKKHGYGIPSFHKFTIMKKEGKIVRPCVIIDFSHDCMVIKSSFSSMLFEEAIIKHDRVIWGKWNSGAEVLAADPEFFQKMTLYMTRAAMVVTMGDFCPNIPEEKDVAL